MMEKKFYPRVGETLYTGTTPSGLKIAVLPRPGFTKKLCYLATNYGAIHREFEMDGVRYSAPAGVAHYLEHKLFEMPGRDITEDFAALGANPNAFTSYDMTAYYFSCTENFPENLRLLLDFVTTPYFTDESVAKEQGIIGQEIDMNLDSPESRLFDLLMEAMYRRHPIAVPILGTRETIAQITPQVLADCHKAFYRAENMFLCVIGDVDPEQVAQMAENRFREVPRPAVTLQKEWDEPLTTGQKEVSIQMEVAMPMFQLGFKAEPLPNGPAGVYGEIVGDLAAEALFGESSGLYMRLYEEGLIDSSFGGGFENVERAALLTVTGDSEDPAAVRDAILAEARHLAATGIPEADLMRLKRSALGRRIRGLDSFDSTCFRLCAFHFSDFAYFDIPEIYEQVTAADVEKFIQTVVTEDRMCLAVIHPKEA